MLNHAACHTVILKAKCACLIAYPASSD